MAQIWDNERDQLVVDKANDGVSQRDIATALNDRFHPDTPYNHNHVAGRKSVIRGNKDHFLNGVLKAADPDAARGKGISRTKKAKPVETGKTAGKTNGATQNAAGSTSVAPQVPGKVETTDVPPGGTGKPDNDAKGGAKGPYRMGAAATTGKPTPGPTDVKSPDATEPEAPVTAKPDSPDSLDEVLDLSSGDDSPIVEDDAPALDAFGQEISVFRNTDDEDVSGRFKTVKSLFCEWVTNKPDVGDICLDDAVHFDGQPLCAKHKEMNERQALRAAARLG